VNAVSIRQSLQTLTQCRCPVYLSQCFVGEIQQQQQLLLLLLLNRQWTEVVRYRIVHRQDTLPTGRSIRMYGTYKLDVTILSKIYGISKTKVSKISRSVYRKVSCQ